MIWTILKRKYLYTITPTHSTSLLCRLTTPNTMLYNNFPFYFFVSHSQLNKMWQPLSSVCIKVIHLVFPFNFISFQFPHLLSYGKQCQIYGSMSSTSSLPATELLISLIGLRWIYYRPDTPQCLWNYFHLIFSIYHYFKLFWQGCCNTGWLFFLKNKMCKYIQNYIDLTVRRFRQKDGKNQGSL